MVPIGTQTECIEPDIIQSRNRIRVHDVIESINVVEMHENDSSENVVVEFKVVNQTT